MAIRCAGGESQIHGKTVTATTDISYGSTTTSWPIGGSIPISASLPCLSNSELSSSLPPGGTRARCSNYLSQGSESPLFVSRPSWYFVGTKVISVDPYSRVRHGHLNQLMSNASGQQPQAPPARDQGIPLVAQELDQGDKLHISFSKGPKRKRLAKVRVSTSPHLVVFVDILSTRLAIHVTRANDAVMELVSGPFYRQSNTKSLR